MLNDHQVWGMFYCGITSMLLHPGYYGDLSEVRASELAKIGADFADQMIREYQLRRNNFVMEVR